MPQGEVPSALWEVPQQSEPKAALNCKLPFQEPPFTSVILISTSYVLFWKAVVKSAAERGHHFNIQIHFKPKFKTFIKRNQMFAFVAF